MKNCDLLNSFTDVLNKRTSNKKELAYQIADILDIEIESAYRRLGGKVQFTIREMGILAEKMNISIDSLVGYASDKVPIFFKMDFKTQTMKSLEEIFKDSLSSQQKLKEKEASIGSLFDTLPIEFFIDHPFLAKFMYFKWGHYFVATKEYDNFSTWEIPEPIVTTNLKLRDYFRRYKKVLYLWGSSLVWNLTNEIKYYKIIDVLTTEDVNLIKNDLHNLLENVEKFAKGDDRYDIELEFYITNFHVALSGYYIFYNDSYLSRITTPFLQSVIHKDYETGEKIYQWINSMKHFSSLISGSGEKERVLFFKEQHAIVNSILNV